MAVLQDHLRFPCWTWFQSLHWVRQDCAMLSVWSPHPSCAFVWHTTPQVWTWCRFDQWLNDRPDMKRNEMIHSIWTFRRIKDKSTHLIGSCDLNDFFNCNFHSITSITSDNERGTLQLVPNGQQGALDEVLHVMLLGKLGHLLTKTYNQEQLIARFCSKEVGTILISPEVPGFWPAKTFVATTDISFRAMAACIMTISTARSTCNSVVFLRQSHPTRSRCLYSQTCRTTTRLTRSMSLRTSKSPSSNHTNDLEWLLKTLPRIATSETFFCFYNSATLALWNSQNIILCFHLILEMTCKVCHTKMNCTWN